MQFNELVFLVFFAVVVLLHRLPLGWSLKKFNLLWLSYVFYAAWNPPFVVLLWLSTLVDWYVGKALYRAESKSKRRWLLAASLGVNLGMLGFFKYGGFVLENFAALCRVVGFDWEPARPSIVLPIGISFYTFQTLSYSIDIYTRRMKPWTSFLDYALYVTFFPQLVAGPIVRARTFLPQCLQEHKVAFEQFGWGLCLFAIGLFEKVVVADACLSPNVEAVFDSREPATFWDAWAGCYGFAVQAFCDFSGYSLCAIGVAKCLGFQLPDNFRFPFAATSFAAFWRRWHISLTSWIRDYVYANVRGRTSVGRSWRWGGNIMLASILIGVWHGAAWHWILWGGVIGVVILVENLLQKIVPPSEFWSKTPAQFALAFITFGVFSFTVLSARAKDMDKTLEMAGAMFGGSSATVPLLSPWAMGVTYGLALGFFLGHWFMRHSSLGRVAERMPWPVKSLLLVGMFTLVLLSRAPDRAFIYFQF